jgi:hypothetical protein
MLVRLSKRVTRDTYRGVNGPVGHPWDYSWLDLPTGIQDTIASFVVTREYVTQRRGGLAPLSSSIPFASRPSAAVSGSGAFIAEGDAPEIREYDIHGNLRRILRVGGFRRPVTRSMVEARINQLASSTNYGRSYWEQRYSEIPIPDTLPAFSSLKADELGWIWAEVFEWDPDKPTNWMVFDPLGQARGTVQTPQGLEVQWIGRDFMLGVWHDSLGVEYVRRHHLNRNLEAGIVS